MNGFQDEQLTLTAIHKPPPSLAQMIMKSLILVASEDTEMTEERRGRPNVGVSGIKDAASGCVCVCV